MALKLKDIPTSTLMTAQTAIEFASREMHGFFQQVIEDEKKGKVGPVYVKELENALEHKILKNNEILSSIEVEVFSRIEKLFPGAVTSKHLPRIIEGYKQELMANEKSKAKKEKPVLSLKTNKEVIK